MRCYLLLGVPVLRVWVLDDALPDVLAAAVVHRAREQHLRHRNRHPEKRGLPAAYHVAELPTRSAL